MARELDLDFEFQDEEVRERPVRPAPRRDISGGRGGSRGPSRGGSSARRRKNDMTSYIILGVEVVVFIALIVLFFVLKSKIIDTEDKADASAQQTSNGVNVESQDFTLTCTRVQIVKDADDEIAALVFFTFVNKTDTPLAMSAVFPAKASQNGSECPEDTNLVDPPQEVENKDMQVSGGQSVECCYAFKLSDDTSPLTLTVHDNYSTYTDIGSTEIPLTGN